MLISQNNMSFIKVSYKYFSEPPKKYHRLQEMTGTRCRIADHFVADMSTDQEALGSKAWCCRMYSWPICHVMLWVSFTWKILYCLMPSLDAITWLTESTGSKLMYR